MRCWEGRSLILNDNRRTEGFIPNRGGEVRTGIQRDGQTSKGGCTMDSAGRTHRGREDA